MSSIEKQWDQLISRSLDGELDEQQQSTFDQLLANNAEFRLRLDEYERIDGLCRQAVSHTLAAVGCQGPATTLSLEDAFHRRNRPAWWLIPLAAAACLALWFFWPQRISNENLAGSKSNFAIPYVDRGLVKKTPLQGPRLIHAGSNGDGSPSELSSSVDRLVGNDRLLVVGEDGNIYVIDQQAVQTARRPSPQGNIRLASY